MVILCNVAYWNLENMKILASKIDPSARLLKTSSYRSFDELNIVDRFYELMKSKKDSKYDKDNDDIIARCRVLRIIEKEKALKKVTAMRTLIVDSLVSNSVDLIITEIVDQYFHDILVREALKLNIKVIAPIQTFVNGYSRLTFYGENQISRLPSKEEVNEVYLDLNKINYQPNYIKILKVSNSITHYKIVFANFLRYIYFSLKLLNPRNKYNYHFLASSISLKKYGNINKITDFKVNKNWSDKIEEKNKPKIYIPLQWYPEATIEYWCPDVNMTDFENVLLKFIKKLSSDFQIVIKEHPAAKGYRSTNLIKMINNLLNEDIYCVPAEIPSNFIIGKINAVLVWTGTVGFEAALRNKPIFTIGKPYYSSGRFFKNVNLETCISEFNNFIKEHENTTIKESEKKDLIHNLLSGFIKGFFRNDGSFDKTNENHIIEINDLADNINKYFKVV